MSNLLNKILYSKFDVEELIQWLLINNASIQKDGCSPYDFVIHLLDFLHKHTEMLLRVDIPASVENKSKIEDTETDTKDNLLLYNEPISKSLISKQNNIPKPLQLKDFMIVKTTTSKLKKKKNLPFNCSQNTQDAQTNNICFSLKKSNNSVTTLKCYNLLKEHQIIIHKLALLYSASITSNLVPDLLKELNYLISLLIANNKVLFKEYSCECSKSILFSSVSTETCLFKIAIEGHYFACVVLENQWNLIKYLNKSTLRILSENESVIRYVPEFATKIIKYIHVDKIEYHNINILNRETLVDTVKFQLDTDSKSNYGNEHLFHAFKNQRDEFYSFLQDWSESMKLQQSSIEFFKSRHKRLRTIFTLCSASTNMYRLADLFVSQILASVFNENFESCEKLISVGIPLTKFDLLNRRFVTPCSIVVGNEKRFPGIQEFFKDFLRSSAENLFFISHVRDVLSHRITKLNNFKFSCDVAVALEKQELFLLCINKLCLLAKFLSLITFLPYQDEEDVPFHLRLPLAEARQSVLPPLDLDAFLSNSFDTGRMIVTIPWIVEFLNGIDNTSILLPYYKTVFAKLQLYLYKIQLPSTSKIENNVLIVYSEEVKKLIKISSDHIISNKNINAVHLTHILKAANDSANDFVLRFTDECLVTINCSRILLTFYINSLFNNVSQSSVITTKDIAFMSENLTLISTEFYIGETALYQCCPQLHEIKYLLEGNKKFTYKSIIPKTEKTLYEQQNNTISVDLLMETHFFDNIPKSVKKCVDFVSEWISSLCVKSLCTIIIPILKSEISQLLKNYSVDNLNDFILSKLYATLKKEVKEELSKFSCNIETSLRSLIELEVTDESIINICIDIACRKCIEIVYNWIFNYINFNDMINKERGILNGIKSLPVQSVGKIIDEKRSKKNVADEKRNEFLEWMIRSNRKFSEDIMSPIEILHLIRETVRNSTDDGHELNIENVLINSVLCIEHRIDLQFLAFRRILMLSVELCTVLILHRPLLITENTLRKFDELWKFRKVCRLHLTFSQILSFRFVHSFQDILWKNGDLVRLAMTNYLVFVINCKLLKVSHLYSQILKLLRYEWSKELLNQISICLNDVLRQCEIGREKIESVIKWIANFIKEDNYW